MKTTPNDLLVIRERMLSPYLTPPTAERVCQLRAQLKADGSWADVNYAGTSTLAWEPAAHLPRLMTLTQAWFTPTSSVHHNAELASEIGRALDCWLHKDPRRPWWWDCIGAPSTLSLILLMLDEHLTDFQRRKGIEILERAVLGSTGYNLVCQAEITAHRAVLQRDADLLRRAFEKIASEIRISDGEGIQEDFSFHQHGHCLYNHGYGANFVEDNARLAALTAGTAFEYPPEKLALLSALILDGSQWMALGSHSDFGAEGREIAQDVRPTALYLGKAAQYMFDLPTGRKNEFRALADRIAGKSAKPLTGNKHFYRSDIMVHHRPGWYMSARMYSTRTLNTDGLSGCDAGLLSHYVAEGATCIMRHGNEYLDIYSVWDWQRVPGTTVELAPHQPGEPSRKGESAFVGGASDGTVGAAAFQLKRGSLRAYKAWFFFSNVVVCMGTGVQCATDHAVVTTLNQCRLHGPVTVGRDNGTEVLDEGERTLDARWIWHDGIGYMFDKAAPVNLSNASRTGNWKRICAQRSSDPVTDKVFMLGLTHGVRPDGVAYAYAVLPGTEAQAMPGFVHEPSFRIATNSVKVQAVYHPGDAALGLVFHEAEQFEWQEWHLVVDRPCVLVIRREQDVWHMAVADPAAGSGTVRLDISWPNGRTHGVNVKLPEGQYVGASTIVRLEQKSSGRESR